MRGGKGGGGSVLSVGELGGECITSWGAGRGVCYQLHQLCSTGWMRNSSMGPP